MVLSNNTSATRMDGHNNIRLSRSRLSDGISRGGKKRSPCNINRLASHSQGSRKSTKPPAKRRSINRQDCNVRTLTSAPRKIAASRKRNPILTGWNMDGAWDTDCESALCIMVSIYHARAKRSMATATPSSRLDGTTCAAALRMCSGPLAIAALIPAH